jgi:hypothetical protein
MRSSTRGGGTQSGSAGWLQTARVTLKTYRASGSRRCLPTTAHAKTVVRTTASPVAAMPVITLGRTRLPITSTIAPTPDCDK